MVAGNSMNAPTKDYSVNGSKQNRIFGSFNAISIIATTYGNGIIPEIQVFKFLTRWKLKTDNVILLGGLNLDNTN